MRRKRKRIFSPWFAYAAVLVVIVAVWIFAQFGLQDERTDRSANKELIGKQEGFDNEEFSSFLERSDIGQLTSYLASIEIGKGQTLPVRLDNLNQKLAVANQIIRLDAVATVSSPENHETGWQAKLEALIERHVILMKMGALNKQLNTGLFSAVAALNREQNKSLLPHIEAAAAIIELVGTNPTISKDVASASAKNQFQIAAEESKDNPWVVEQLYEVVMVLVENHGEEFARPFAGSLLDQIGTSVSSNSLAMRQSLNQVIVGSENDLVDIETAGKSELSDATDKLIRQIEIGLSRNSVSELFIEQVLLRSGQLVALNQIDQAQAVLDLLEQKKEALNSDQQNQLEAIARQKTMIGAKLELRSLTDFDGHPIILQQKPLRIIFFTNRNADKQIIAQSNRLQQILQASANRVNCELLFVYVNEGSDQDAQILQNLRQMSKRMPVARICVLEAKDNPEVNQSYFLAKRRFLLVALNQESEVQLVNPKMPEIEFLIANANSK